MLTSPPVVLLIVALIYLPYASLHIWRIHSAQRIIEYNHSVSSWKFQQKEEEECAARMQYYCMRFSIFVWIATCCVLEICFGHYAQFELFDYCILFAGCAGAALICVWMQSGTDSNHPVDGTFASVAKVLAFSIVFAIEWEIAVLGLLFCGIVLLMPEPAKR